MCNRLKLTLGHTLYEPHQTGVTLYPLHQIILTGVVFLKADTAKGGV